jgi:hypothetical protein
MRQYVVPESAISPPSARTVNRCSIIRDVPKSPTVATLMPSRASHFQRIIIHGVRAFTRVHEFRDTKYPGRAP